MLPRQKRCSPSALRRRENENLRTVGRIGDARIRGVDESVQFNVVDVAIAIGICGATEGRADLVGEDAGLVPAPLVGISIGRCGENEPHVVVSDIMPGDRQTRLLAARASGKGHEVALAAVENDVLACGGDAVNQELERVTRQAAVLEGDVGLFAVEPPMAAIEKVEIRNRRLVGGECGERLVERRPGCVLRVDDSVPEEPLRFKIGCGENDDFNPRLSKQLCRLHGIVVTKT